MDRDQKVERILLLEEKRRRAHVYRYRTMLESRYPWQMEFIRNTAHYSQLALIAANRTGKTETGTYVDAIHALGDYPDDWPGHVFNSAPLIWCLGYSGEKIRDLLQTPIIGVKGEGNKFSGGLIPPEHIVGWEAMTGTPNALRTVYIRQVGGGDIQAKDAKIQFWSYSQGQHALMGDAVDWVHIDEEPVDQNIWPQVLTRTATGDKGNGGRCILTFTPENGRTDLVIKFMDDPAPAQHCMNVGWDDAPHLTAEVKETLLQSYPEHQRDMRTKGIPMLGHGRIYDLSEEVVTCDAFEVPEYFFVIDGMDFGWDHPQAHIQLVEDRESGVFYVVQAYKQAKVSPDEAWGATKKWSDGVPTAWPLDGLQTEKGSGKQQKAYYKDAGFKMCSEYATWPDGSNGVEAGLYEILDLMRKGKFKIFKGLRPLIEEFLQYHRDDKGKIVKSRDDLLDAMRYAYMMRRFAVRKGHIKNRPVRQATAQTDYNVFG